MNINEETVIKLSVFNGDNWENIYTKKIPYHISLEKINFEVENEEYIGIDVNPEHMPVTTAIEINVEMINKICQKLDKLPHDEIIEAYLKPSKNRGTLEKILMNHLY